MYMSINSNETIESFNGCGRKTMVESFERYKFDNSWTQYIWTYYCQWKEHLHIYVIWYKLLKNENKKGQILWLCHLFMRIMALDIQNIHFKKANGLLHLGMRIFHVEDGLGNSIT